MDWPCSQQAWGNPQSLPDLQSHLVAQNSDDLKGGSDTFANWYDNIQNYTGCSLIPTNLPSQTVPLFNPQPHFSPEPHTGLIHYCHAGYAASSSFGQSPGVELPLSAEYQFSANEQSFQQTFLPLSQPESTAELNLILIPYGDATYDSFSGFEHALTADAALATQRIGEPYFHPRSIGQCVRCWADRKPVSLFI